MQAIKIFEAFITRRFKTRGKSAKYIMAGWIIFILLVAAFGKLIEAVFLEKGFSKDLAFLKWVHMFVAPPLTQLMIGITQLASLKFIVISTLLLLIIFIIRHRFVNAVTLAILTAGSGGLIVLFKFAFHRPRPQIFAPLTLETSFGFPSGHSLIAISFYGFLAYLFVRQRRKGLNIPVAAILIALVGLIGLSRIYLSVHWPSDVLGGYIAGGAWLVICILLSEKFRIKYSHPPNQ
jgi:membrane-associated phospholipid phosphatase